MDSIHVQLSIAPHGLPCVLLGRNSSAKDQGPVPEKPIFTFGDGWTTCKIEAEIENDLKMMPMSLHHFQGQFLSDFILILPKCHSWSAQLPIAKIFPSAKGWASSQNQIESAHQVAKAFVLQLNTSQQRSLKHVFFFCLLIRAVCNLQCPGYSTRQQITDSLGVAHTFKKNIHGRLV